MTRSKKCGLVLAGFLGLCGLQVGEQLGVPGVQGFVSRAEAVVGRPLTPVSVAGVARRSTRRCAAGVTYC